MPTNKGRKPPHERVDIKLRCGVIVRDTPSENWRWKPWPEGEHAGDIVVWQKAGALTEWKQQVEDRKAA